MSSIVLIAAVSENNVIGKDNDLPWSLKDDLRLFSHLTREHTIIMGRKNYESIGKPLPNRLNIVLSRNPAYEAEGCIVTSSLDDAINMASGTAFIIGGADIYKMALPKATHFFRSVVHAEVEGDVRFPDNDVQWEPYYECQYHQDVEGGNQYPFTFQMMKRKPEPPHLRARPFGE